MNNTNNTAISPFISTERKEKIDNHWFPCLYFVKHQIEDLQKEGYELTPIGEFLLEDEENMRYIDLSAITLINSKNEDDFVCIHYILQNAYDEECNELDYQHQLDEMYKSTNEEMEWNEPMGCYVPKYNYYD